MTGTALSWRSRARAAPVWGAAPLEARVESVNEDKDFGVRAERPATGARTSFFASGVTSPRTTRFRTSGPRLSTTRSQMPGLSSFPSSWVGGKLTHTTPYCIFPLPPEPRGIFAVVLIESSGRWRKTPLIDMPGFPLFAPPCPGRVCKARVSGLVMLGSRISRRGGRQSVLRREGMLAGSICQDVGIVLAGRWWRRWRRWWRLFLRLVHCRAPCDPSRDRREYPGTGVSPGAGSTACQHRSSWRLSGTCDGDQTTAMFISYHIEGRIHVTCPCWRLRMTPAHDLSKSRCAAALHHGGAALAPRRSAVDPRCDRGDGGITLPPGFCASVFADEVGVARHLVVTPTGDVYVALENANRSSANSTRVRGANGRGGMVALRDTNADGRADIKRRIEDVSNSGMALQGPWLYVSSVTSVLRYRLEPGSLAPVGAPDTVVTGFPTPADTAVAVSPSTTPGISSSTSAPTRTHVVCQERPTIFRVSTRVRSSTCELAFGASIPNAFIRSMTFRSVTRPAFATPLDSPGAQAFTLSTPPSTAATAFTRVSQAVLDREGQ